MMLHAHRPPKHGGLAPDPVNDVTCERGADSIHQRERGSQQSQLDLVEVHLHFEQRKYRKDGLAVGVVEEAAEP